MSVLKRAILALLFSLTGILVFSFSAFAYSYPPISGVDFYLPNWYSSPYNVSSYPNGKWFQFFTVNGNGYPYYIEVCLNSSNLSALSIYPTLMSDNRIAFYVHNNSSSAVSVSSAHCWIYDGVTNSQLSHLTAFGSTTGFTSSGISGANYNSVSVSSNGYRTICFWTSSYSRPYVTSWGGGMLSGSGTLYGVSYNAPTILPLNFTVNGSSVIDPDDGSISGGVVISGTYDPDTGAFTFNFPFVDYSNQFTLIVNRQDTIIQRLDSILLALSNLQLDNSDVVQAIEDSVSDIEETLTTSDGNQPDPWDNSTIDDYNSFNGDVQDSISDFKGQFAFSDVFGDEFDLTSFRGAMTFWKDRFDEVMDFNPVFPTLVTTSLALGLAAVILGRKLGVG